MEARYFAAVAAGMDGVVVWRLFRLLDGQLTSLQVGPSAIMPVEPGEDLERRIQLLLSGAPVRVVELRTLPSMAYARMARRRTDHGSFPEEWTGQYHREMASLRQQLDALTDILMNICRVVEPTPANLRAYGHEIRNLLLLACTEIETQWRGVMHANGYGVTKPTRLDYIKLAEPLRLYDYQVRLLRFPDLPPSTPFGGWAGAGTLLPWYDAYNAVKHNREVDFSCATLGNAIDAICGLVALAYAQYGPRIIDLHLPAIYEVTAPEWEPEHWYFVDTDSPNPHEEQLRRGNHPFT